MQQAAAAAPDQQIDITVLDDTLGVLLNHIDSAHLEESLGQQITDLLDVDSYVKMHTVWAEHLLAPTEDFLTGSC